MPVVCTDSTATLYGTLTQQADQNMIGGHTWGLADPTNTSGATVPASCLGYQNDPAPPHQNPLPSINIRQFIAYIPNTDFYGNDLTGVVATGTGPTVVGGKVTRQGWLYQVNNECSPDATVNPPCKNTGGLWSGFAIGTGSNLFTSGPYSGFYRPDQPNTVVAASMNGTMSEAYKIRSDTTYHPVIHTIYLTGNGKDAIDREFLPIVSNYPNIIPIPYDPQYSSTATTPTVLYANPAYQTGQETGKYLVTADKNALTGLFAQLASEVLRLSH
jgi:hypothetical protein